MPTEFTLDAVPEQLTITDDAFKVTEKGQKERIGICWFPQDEDGDWDESKVKCVFDLCHYVKGMGYILSTPEIDEILSEPGRPRAGGIEYAPGRYRYYVTAVNRHYCTAILR